MSQYVTNMPPKEQSYACPALLEYALKALLLLPCIKINSGFKLTDTQLRSKKKRSLTRRNRWYRLVTH